MSVGWTRTNGRRSSTAIEALRLEVCPHGARVPFMRLFHLAEWTVTLPTELQLTCSFVCTQTFLLGVQLLTDFLENVAVARQRFAEATKAFAFEFFDSLRPLCVCY